MFLEIGKNELREAAEIPTARWDSDSEILKSIFVDEFNDFICDRISHGERDLEWGARFRWERDLYPMP